MSGGAFAFGPVRRPRRPSLTPLIDVVFLLLVFFMLVARFGAETGLPVRAGTGGGDAWEGPPRLIVLGADGVALNGVPVAADALAGRLAPLMPAPESPVVLRAGPGASVDLLAATLGALQAAGIGNVVVVE